MLNIGRTVKVILAGALLLAVSASAIGEPAAVNADGGEKSRHRTSNEQIQDDVSKQNTAKWDEVIGRLNGRADQTRLGLLAQNSHVIAIDGRRE